MPFPNEHALRLRDPDDFADDSFRRTPGARRITVKDVGAIDVPESIDIIWAKLTGASAPDDPVLAQSLRFPIEDWTEAQARDWVSDNDLAGFFFEPATEEESQRSKRITSAEQRQRQAEAELD